MDTKYRVTSYDIHIGRKVDGPGLLQSVECLNRVDAFTIYRALTAAGYDVLVQEVTEQTSGTIRDITTDAAALEANR